MELAKMQSITMQPDEIPAGMARLKVTKDTEIMGKTIRPLNVRKKHIRLRHDQFCFC